MGVCLGFKDALDETEVSAKFRMMRVVNEGQVSLDENYFIDTIFDSGKPMSRLLSAS